MSKKTRKVFLGGTVADTTWRDELIPQLKMDFYNPVVDDWTDEALKQELYEREHCDFNLYVLSPKQIGVYSLAEVIDDSNKRPLKTIYCYMQQDGESRYTERELDSLSKIGMRVEDNGGIWCKNLAEVIDYLNRVQSNDAYLKTYRAILKKSVTWYQNPTHINLLTGFYLEDAKRWFQESEQTEALPPTRLMRRFFSKSVEDDEFSDRPNVFISYARNPSLEFATALFKKLAGEPYNYQVWFDKSNIRAGVDYRDEISVGIEKSGNFIFIISPRAVTSPHTAEELDLAKKYSKRILPIQHIDPDDLSDIDPDIQDIHRVFYEPGRDLDSNVDKLAAIMATSMQEGRDYIRDHTQLLQKALDWERTGYQASFLLKGRELIKAANWLRTARNSQVPALPSNLHGSYISRSKWVAENHFADIWLIAEGPSRELNRLESDLNRKGIVTAVERTGTGEQTETDILKSARVLFCATAESMNSDKCLYELEIAGKYSIPYTSVVLTPGAETAGDNGFDLSDDSIRQGQFEELLNYLEQEDTYYQELRYLRYKTSRWLQNEGSDAHLMREQAIDHYEYIGNGGGKNKESRYPEIARFLKQSKDRRSSLGIGVFILYQSTDQDFAFRLNEQLNDFDKATWMEQEYLRGNAKATELVNEALDQAENVVIVISEGMLTRDRYQSYVNRAMSNNKRLLFVYEEQPGTLPQTYREVPQIDFDKDFEQASLKLLKELNTDHEHVSYHTRLLRLASEWQGSNKSKERLLIGADYQLAQAWLDGAASKNPRPTLLQREYVQGSAKAIKARARRSRLITQLIIFLGILSIAFGIFAIYQSRQARDNAEKARASAQQARDNAETAAANELRAKRNAKVAEENEKKANRAKELALQSEQAARLAEGDAREAESTARKAEQEALTQREIARRQARLNQAKVLSKDVRNLLSLNQDSMRNYAIDLLKAYYIYQNDGGPAMYPDAYQGSLRVLLNDTNYTDQAHYYYSVERLTGLSTYAWAYLPTQKTMGLVVKEGREMKLIFGRFGEGRFISMPEEYALPGISYVEQVIFSPAEDRAYLATSSGAFTLRLEAGARLEPFGESRQEVRALALTGTATDYGLALKTPDSVFFYEVIDGAPAKRWQEPSLNFYENSLSLRRQGADYQLLTGNQRQFLVYTSRAGSSAVSKRSRYLPSGQVTAVAHTPDGRYLLAGTDNGVIYHYSKDLRLISSYTGGKSSVRKIVTTPVFYLAYTNGNQLQNSKLIISRLSDLSTPQIIETDMAEATIKGMLVHHDELYLLQNENELLRQLVKTSQLIEVLCQRYASSESEACDDFKSMYEGTGVLKNGKLIYCDACQ